MKRFLMVAAAAFLIAVPASSAAGTDSSELRAAITLNALVDTLEELQQIADENGGTRASGTSGFTDSVAFVAGEMRQEGYRVTVQNFPFAFFQETSPAQFQRVSPNPVTFVQDTDFDTMTYSGSGDLSARVQAVDTQALPSSTSTSGCETSDFTGFVGGRIALMQRGTCTFAVKATNAQAAGASAAVIFNRDAPSGLIVGTLGAPGVTIPVLGTTFAVGQGLFTPPAESTVVARIFTETISEIRQTSNVIAETRGGNPNRVVVAGAHLDSVIEGPGIVDNGSGIATLLETARQLDNVVDIDETGADQGGLVNKLRFAFWGGEELGLLGSQAYLNQLTPAQRSKITVNVNFDMLASSNGVYFVQDGDRSTFPGPPLPGRSAELEHVFNDYFASQGLPTEPRPYDGRSDYQSFINAGIGAGGLTSGSDHIKTPDQAARFGGTAGMTMHPTYHTAGDRLNTVNLPFLDVLSDAGAHAILWFAMEGASVGGGDEQ